MKNGEVHSEEWITDARQYWWNDDYLALLLKRYGLADITSLADIGCGDGYMTNKLIPHLKNISNCYLRDIEKTHIENASKNLSKYSKISFNYSICDAGNLDIDSNTVDLAVCQTLLLHMKDPQNAINEMRRITKKGGTIMAIETNNAVNNLITNSIIGKNNSFIVDDIDNTLDTLKYDLIIQKGIFNLEEGYLSIGDYLPKLFLEAGLKDIQVSILDKACALIPPYDTPEKKAIANELLSWIDNSSADYDYNQMLKYYIAGGGNEQDFKLHWAKKERENKIIKEAVLSEKYIMPGGALMYIVTAKNN